jgi:hypothetical protein
VNEAVRAFIADNEGVSPSVEVREKMIKEVCAHVFAQQVEASRIRHEAKAVRINS